MAAIKKTGFWRSDALLGIVVSLFILVLGSSPFIQSLERQAYDAGVKATARTPSSKIAVIAIDKASLDNIGRWPWSRDIMADMVERLAAAKAKVIATTVFFSEPQRDAGLTYIERMIAACEVTPLVAAVPVAEGEVAVPEPTPLCPLIEPTLREAEIKLNTDRRLGKALAGAGNVALPMLFSLGEPLGRPDGELPAYVKGNAVSLSDGESPPSPALSVDANVIPALGAAARAIGHLNVDQDVDGAIRKDPLIIDYYGQYYPALSLLVAANSLNLTPADIKGRAGSSVRWGRLKIATDQHSRRLTFFYRGAEGADSAFWIE